MTTTCNKVRGLRASFAMLGAVAMLLLTHGRAEAIENLPAPGAYILQRIQRIPEAQLLDANGAPVALSSHAVGAVTALGFFYGHCEDATGCPVAWATFEAARKAAGADPLLKDKLRLVFVSLDPQRDTPAVLRILESSERDSRAPPWIFLTGKSEVQLAPLLRAMGQDVGYALDPSGRRTGTINHMLKVFLIDPEGWVREIYSTAFLTPENLLNDARTLALVFRDATNRLPEK